MKNRKLLMTLGMIACAALLVVGSVLGTVAYLTATATVKNTFTFGKVAITMVESKVDLYGVKTSGTTTTNEYKLIPGQTYVKDPVITVTAGSEACYLFVKITNPLASVEKASDANTKTIADQLAANGWTALDGHAGVYSYCGVVDALENAQTVNVFENFTISNAQADLSAFENAEVEIVAYAVQAAGFANAKAAFEGAGFGA